MRRLLMIIILGFVLSSGSFAQETNDEKLTDNYKNELGFNIGASTGIGFSYRNWIQNFGFQTTIMPYKGEDDILFSAGLSFMYSLKNTKYLRTYLYWGNHFFYDYEEDNSVYYDEFGNCYYVSKESKSYNSGFGLGFSFGRIVAFNIAFGYGAYDILGGWNSVRLLPVGEIGLYYKF